MRKLIDKADELAIDKAKRLEAAKIGYAENVRNAHRTLGDLLYPMYDVPVSKH